VEGARSRRTDLTISPREGLGSAQRRLNGSSLYIVAGRYPWLSLKRGGVLGIALCTVNMALSIPFAALDAARR
jgi:hypothetical protein